jgi:hypothetical protein
VAQSKPSFAIFQLADDRNCDAIEGGLVRDMASLLPEVQIDLSGRHYQARIFAISSKITDYPSSCAGLAIL